jgi:hypothetical protein
MFSSYGNNLPETSALEVIFLGASLLAGPPLNSVLVRKRLELWRLQLVELMLSHENLYLLRNVLTAPCMTYVVSPELLPFDGMLHESLIKTMNIDLDGDRWSQTLLP